MNRLTLPCIALLIACGGGPSPASPGDQALSLEAYLAVEHRATCEKNEACASSYGGWPAYTTSAEDCVAEHADIVPSTDTARRVAAGRVLYDEADARACLDIVAEETRTLGCEAWWRHQFDDPAPEPCRTALRGTAADGAACTHWSECATFGALCADAACLPPE